MMTSKKSVLDGISQAFKSAKMPRSESELTNGGIDGPSVVANFLGKSRQYVDSSEFKAALYMEDYSYMTTMAKEYYLPCALTAMLRIPYDDELWIYLFSFLKRNRKGKLQNSLDELSTKQLDAIYLWASYLHQQLELLNNRYIDSNEVKELAVMYTPEK